MKNKILWLFIPIFLLSFGIAQGQELTEEQKAEITAEINIFSEEITEPVKEFSLGFSKGLEDIIKDFRVAICSPNIEKDFPDPIKIAEHLRRAEVDENLISLIEKGLNKEYTPITSIPFFNGVNEENFWAVSKLSFGWEEVWDKKVKEGDAVAFDLALDENFLTYLLFLDRYKDKVGIRVITWDNRGLNNFDVRDTALYPEILVKSIIFNAFSKAVSPEEPTFLCVCRSAWSDSDTKWLEACPFRPDGLLLWNIPHFGLEEGQVDPDFPNIRKIFSPYLIIIAPVNCFGDVGDKTEGINLLKQSEIDGLIWYK